MAVDLANASAAAGHDVAMILAYPVDRTLLQDDLDPRVRVKFIGRRRARFTPYLLLVPWILRNRSWLSGFDILHAHLTFGSVFAEAVQQLRRFSRPMPKTVETYHAVGTPVPLLSHRLHRILASRHDGFVKMARDSRWSRFVADHPSLKWAFIPNGITVDPEPVTPARAADFRARAAIPDGVTVMGTIGRLLAERHPEELMKVFLRVAAQDPDVHFLIGGEGPLREPLTKQAAAAGFGDRFHLPGLVVDPAAALANIDLYLTLNVRDVTGIAALEAAVRAIPVIAHQADPGYRDGKGDWIESSNDPAVLAQRALDLIASPEARGTLGSEQRKTVRERFSAERMASDYARFYEELLD